MHYSSIVNIIDNWRIVFYFDLDIYNSTTLLNIGKIVNMNKCFYNKQVYFFRL